jgi:hypothetical protein
MRETADWLTTHLTGQSAEYVQIRSRVDAAKSDGSRQFLGHRGSAQPEVVEVKETITSAALDGCHLTLTADRITTGQGTRTSRESQFMVPLEQVDDAYLGELEHQPERSASVVETFMPKTTNILHIGAAQPVIAFTTHTTSVVIDKPTTNTSDSGTYHLIELPSDDTGLAERTVLALRHAINLCHTSLKPEPF